MALKKQAVKVAFTNGVDTKTDPYLTTKLQRADNVLFDANTPKTRGPFMALEETTLTAPERLSEWKNSLLIEDNNTLIVRTQGTDSVTNQVLSRPVEKQTLDGSGEADSFSQLTPDTSFLRYGLETQSLGTGGEDAQFPSRHAGASSPDGSSCYVWQKSTSAHSIEGLIVNDYTGALTLRFTLNVDKFANEVVYGSRVLYSASTGKFYIYYLKYASAVYSLCMRSIDVATPVTWGPEETIGLGAAPATKMYDVAYDATSNTFYSVTLDDVDQIRHAIIDADGSTVLYQTNILATGGQVVGATACISNDGTFTKYYAFYNVTALGQIYVSGIDPDGFDIAETTLIDFNSILSTPEPNMVTVIDPGAALPLVGAVTVWTGGAATSVPVVATFTVAKDTLTATWGNYFPGVIVHSAMVYDTMHSRYLLPVFRSRDTVTPTLFVADITSLIPLGATDGATVIRTPPPVVARVEYGNCAPIWPVHFDGPLGNTSLLGDGSVSVPFMRWTNKRDTVQGILRPPYSLYRAVLSGPKLTRGQLGDIQVMNCTMLAGGCPQWFDGLEVHEAGFNYRPYVSCTAGSGGSLAAGTYGVYVTYAYADAQGNWHESAPSDIASVVVGASGTIAATVDTYGLTTKQTIYVRVYRTTVDAVDTATALLDSSQAMTVPMASRAVAQGVMVVTLSGGDTALLRDTPIPTAAALPNTPPPACRHIAAFQDRLWLSGVGDGYNVVFSQEFGLGGVAPEWALDLGRRVPLDYGRVVGTGEMESRIAVFCENQLAVIYGTGPTPFNTQDNYSAPTLVTHEGAQWQSPKSIVHTREGIWYHAQGGLRLVQNDGALAMGQDGRELGSEVDNFLAAGATIVAGIRHKQREVWFADLTGTSDTYHPTYRVNVNGIPIHVWNWQWRQWTRQTISRRCIIASTASTHPPVPTLAALANLCDFVVAADVPTTIFSTPLESFTRVAVATWAPDETYASNIYVTNGGNIYFGGGGPTASSGGPTGTGAGIADGDATWDYVAADPAAPSAWYYFRSGTTYNSAAYRDDYDGSNDYTYDFEYLSADSGRRIFSWLRTSLLALAGIQGFQRVYRAQIIGGGTGVTGAGMYATFSDGSVDEASWAGGFEFEHLFSLQKCESIQLEFWWTAATRKHLTALNLLVGVKSDYARLPSGQRG